MHFTSIFNHKFKYILKMKLEQNIWTALAAPPQCPGFTAHRHPLGQLFPEAAMCYGLRVSDPGSPPTPTANPASDPVFTLQIFREFVLWIGLRNTSVTLPKSAHSPSTRTSPVEQLHFMLYLIQLALFWVMEWPTRRVACSWAVADDGGSSVC